MKKHLLTPIMLLVSFLSLATQHLVINNNDSGAGSLREKITIAAAGDTILFDASLNGSTITLTSGNIAFAKSLWILGPGYDLLTISGNNNSRIFDITAGDVYIRGLRIENGSQTVSAPNEGGAIRHKTSGNLHLSNIYFFNNRAVNGNGSQGGAVYYQVNGGFLNADTCFFMNSQSDNYGGAMSCNGGPNTITLNTCWFDGNSAVNGPCGALFTNATNLYVTNSTFSNNSAGQRAAIWLAGYGSTYYSFKNSTFSNNTITSGSPYREFGAESGTFELINCTYTNNDEPIYVGQSYYGPVLVNLQNSIFNNSGSNFSSYGSPTFNSTGGNVSNDATMSAYLTATNDLNNTNPMLDVLADNGGLMSTHQLLAGSPAIGNGIALGAPTSDQLGSPRTAPYDAGSINFVATTSSCSIVDQTASAAQATVCENGSTSIQLSSSELGVSYYLRNDLNDTIIDGPVTGNGSGISFNTGMLNQTTTFNVNATIDQAVDLPTVSDRIVFNSPFYSYTNELTIDAWVYSATGGYIWAGQSTLNADNMTENVWLWHGNNFQVNNNGTWRTIGMPLLSAGWTHVSTVANASGLYVYYNGNLVTSTTSGITSGIRNNSSSGLVLGSDPRYPPGDPGRNCDVAFDNFRVWNVAHSASDVTNLMNDCNVSSDPNLVLYTNFTEGTGTTIASEVGANGEIINPTTNWISGHGVCVACEQEMSTSVTVTINPTTSSTINVTECNTYTVPSGDESYTMTGVYTDTIPNALGCDSIITINLTINNSTTGTDAITACDSYTWIDGITYNASNNTATHTLTNAAGCDSVVTLSLTINYSNTGTDAITACDSYTWINGITYNASNNTATHTLTNAAGCDSVVTLNLTINYSNTGTDAITACDSYTWIDGITYNASNNTATHTLTNAAGCDSVVTLNLTINYSNTGTDAITACDSYTWIDGITYNASNNTATHTLTNAAGCDSVVTLNLTINYSNTGTDAITACDSYTWIDGITYNASNNTATHTLTNAAGCDSVVTLNLTINYSNTGTDAITACDSYTWIDGITYNASNNTATHTLTNAAGCDSLVTLNLTINYSNTGTDAITACDSYTWIDGITYNASNNTATHTLTNAAGCDSVVTLNLTINYSNTGTDAITACDSYTWIDGITYNASNNIATHTLTNAAGCDSVVTLNLTINSVSDITTTLVGETITATNSNATYQWLDCDNNYAIVNLATNQSFTATDNGNYAVEITENGCVDTSACVTISSTGLFDTDLGSVLKVYPNPTTGDFTIDLDEIVGSVNVRITDINGRFIQQTECKNAQILDLNLNQPAGVYLLIIQSNDKNAIIRLVKE